MQRGEPDRGKKWFRALFLEGSVALMRGVRVLDIAGDITTLRRSPLHNVLSRLYLSNYGNYRAHRLG